MKQAVKEKNGAFLADHSHNGHATKVQQRKGSSKSQAELTNLDGLHESHLHLADPFYGDLP